MRLHVVLTLLIPAAYACSSSSAPAKLLILSSAKVLAGASQTGTVQTALPSPIVVQAVDGSGRPIAGLSVIYGPSDGSLNPGSATTDSTGRASTTWTLGTKAGRDTLLIAVTQNGTSGPGAVVQDTVYATANP
jgi:hypothetical protein